MENDPNKEVYLIFTLEARIGIDWGKALEIKERERKQISSGALHI